MKNHPATPPQITEREGARRVLPRHEWQMIGIIISIKALLFLFAGQSYQVLQNQRVAGARGWLEIWNRWDAVNYQKIAEFGYTATGEMRPLLVFYPLYPWTVRLLAFFTRDYMFSFFFTSTHSSHFSHIFLLR